MDFLQEVIKRRDFLVHDEGEISREGDLVRIEQCRPISKRKAFSIAEIRKNQGQQFAKYDELAKAQVVREENEKTREFLQRRKNTTKDINENSSFIKDLAIVEKGASRRESELSESLRLQIATIKAKYGIKSWPPQKEVLKLEVQTLREELESLTDSIGNLVPRLEGLLNDKEKSDNILSQLGHNPETLKSNVRKNILRKYLLKSSVSNKVKGLEI